MSQLNTVSLLGSGWLGLALARYFVKRGYSVKASTRTHSRIPALKAEGATPFVIDIGQLDDALATVESFLDTDVLIVNITSKDPGHFCQLINKIESSKLTLVLFISSTSVYQDHNSVVTESDQAESADSILFQIENLFRRNQQFQSTIVRLAGLFGDDRHPGQFFRQGSTVSNAGGAVNLVHRDDCVNIIGRIVEQGVWGEVFNVCADTHPSRQEFYAKARASLNLPVLSFSTSKTDSYKIVSNEKVKKVLAYDFIYGDLMRLDFDHD